MVGKGRIVQDSQRSQKVTVLTVFLQTAQGLADER